MVVLIKASPKLNQLNNKDYGNEFKCKRCKYGSYT